ncbi:MAG: AraC-like DNA-binding protein/quercetin dioxygenase-like cupin family protein [Paraglaciecola sp.]|jgi:AraC-like DNA-binding protein/quercetin dioxygenase-like cupin family protein
MLANELIKDSGKNQVITKTIYMPRNYVDDWHTHPWHQIIFPVKGLLQSSLGEDNFIVPHNGMLYVPSNTPHKSIAVTKTQFLSIYINPVYAKAFPNESKSCAVMPFLKELILLLVHRDSVTYPDHMISNLLLVLNDQLLTAHNYKIPLLIPHDRRLNSIFTQLQQQPDLKLTLSDWARKVGASERTLSRICVKEFNQSFSLWRQNVRLVLAIQLLEDNHPINRISLELGYTSDSAFIHAFKGLFNQTPAKYRKSCLLADPLIQKSSN